MMRTLLATACGLSLLAACQSSRHPTSMSSRNDLAPLAADEHSFSNPNQVRVRHLELKLELDFETRRASGTARLSVARIDPSADLVLDDQGLEIERVLGDDGAPRAFELGEERAGFGRPLRIRLAPGDDHVTIAYRTGPQADAMQWLAPEQTAGGRQPFLFTQGQAVLTRTWIPLQDSPGVRITYEAEVRAPETLVAVMSAEQLGRDGHGVWRFRMPQAIPPYLIALSCGDLEFRPLSARCGVWAERPLIERAAVEFEDTEAMVAAAEKLFGPYRWGRYDLLILPPSFPYGGMENPRLTFATPTVIAGDKSLVGLVAHELAHSWSGNLVTNATWRDFWLNEGTTTYFENRIMEALYGVERARMEQALGLADLEKEMADLAPRDTVLHIDLAGRHPDDGFSQVPYDKGALFLRRLEQVFGRPRFDEFLRGWFDSHAFQSVTTDDFARWIRARLFHGREELAAQIDVDRWLDQPGLPGDAPRPVSDAMEAVDRAVAAWTAGAPLGELSTRSWITQQWLHFIEALPVDLTTERMAQIDAAFGFTNSGNSEILCAWLTLAARQGYHAADARTEEFLMNVGRRKFLKPLYAELAKTPEGKARALALYGKARPRYHAVATKTLDELLGWKG